MSTYRFDFGSDTRDRIFRFVVIAVMVVYSGRLAYLQIIRGSEYLEKSETQAIKQITIKPFRGFIYDRFGKVIVQNTGLFALAITPNDYRVESSALLSSLTGIPTNELNALAKTNLKKRFNQITILRDINQELIAQIEENKNLLPGVDVIVESKRQYDFEGNGAHLLGYCTEISDKQLSERGDEYEPGDMIGQTGLESSYDWFLRGNKGAQFVAMNAAGMPVESFNKGKADRDAIEGNDLYTGIDIRLQEIAERELKDWRGAAVVINPRNGEIMALVSKPDYDLREFASGKPSEIYTRLKSDTARVPLFNRAMQTAYPPGSTWKMLMAIAAMNEGVIDEKSTISCGGSYTYGGRSFKCHGAHGAVTVQKSIHVSCNVFYYKLGQMLGIDLYNKYGKMFGFGQQTFVDVAGESRGLLADKAYFERRGIKGNLITGRMVNLGIGQGEIGVTPLQMATYCAAIANKGTLYQPHVVKEFYNRFTGRREKIATDFLKLPLDSSIFETIHQGMYDCVNKGGGTATGIRIPDVAVCGKTGTAQNPHGKDHAWFVCFAPRVNPEIAMCVMVENVGFGGTYAAPIARKIMDEYFHKSKGKDSSATKADSSKRNIVRR